MHRYYNTNLDGTPVPHPPLGWVLLPQSAIVPKEHLIYINKHGWYPGYDEHPVLATYHGVVRAYAVREDDNA